MPTLAIIADDLTGANDTGVQLARQGAACALSPYWTEELPELDAQADVWVFNTESRHVPPKEAARRVSKVVGFARKHGVKALYKKTDSALRGPVGAELEAALKTWNAGPLIYAPAFPSAGRIMRAGRLFVDGVPLAETAFANDPLAPIRTSRVVDIVSATSRTVLDVIDLAGLRAGQADLTSPNRIVIVEGESDDDLERTALLATQGSLPTCWAGPAAFAFHLLQLFNVRTGTPQAAKCKKPFLIVNGSLHPVSIGQTDYAIAQGFVPVEVDAERFERGNLASKAIAALKEGKDVALYHVCLVHRDPEGVNRRLTTLTQQILESVLPGTLLFFGGETSQTLLRRVEAGHCRIINQIDWGIVLIEASTPSGAFNIVTKSGGFGPPDFLERIIR